MVYREDMYTRALDLLQWADVAFFDFLHPPLTWASNLVNVKCRITARLHGLEVYDRSLKDADWSRIHLIASQPQMLRWQRKKNWEGVPAATSEHTINLGVDVTPTAKPKEVFGHNIAITAFTPLPRKRIYTTIESFYDLLAQTRLAEKQSCWDWSLHIRGTDVNRNGWRGEEAAEYVDFIDELAFEGRRLGINDRSITLHSYMDDANWQRFLAGTDIIISNSMQEGYHKSILEAMAYGAMPFVHRWIGADFIYPPQCLFLTQRELVNNILTYAALSLTEKQHISLQLQDIVKAHHDEKKLAIQAVDVILGVNS
jgi:hypothetical protein